MYKFGHLGKNHNISYIKFTTLLPDAGEQNPHS